MKSGWPGVSARVTEWRVPSSAFHSRNVRAGERVVLRATSSGWKSVTVVPASTLPGRGIAPARCRTASTIVVMPEPALPTTAAMM